MINTIATIKRNLSDKKFLMLGDFMIYMAMLRNGAVMIGMTIIKERQQIHRFGQEILRIMKTAKLKSCCAVVRITTLIGIVGLHLATTLMHLVRKASTVFGLFALCAEDSLLYSLALFNSLYFFTLL